MGASITLAGADLIAQKHIAQEGLDVVRFIFANVPGLDQAAAVDRAAGLPPVEQIVHTAVIPAENKGYVNPNQVVYSVQVGSDVGDWDFNWIGLETAEGVLFAVSYVPLQQKRRNIPPLQLGNNLTRNFLVVFDGAQALTGITIDASTWQHDFTVRLAGIDERERLSNRDVYGRACFFGNSLQLEKVGGAYQLKPGTAYVEGIRLDLNAALPVVPDAVPGSAWLDVALVRALSDVIASWQVVWGADLVDYADGNGVLHHLVQIADLPDINAVNDLRPVEPIDSALVAHFAARIGDYEGLRARATTKDDVGLSELPNAKSDDETTDSSEILATTKAVKRAFSRAMGLYLLDATSAPVTFTLPAANAALGIVELTLRRTDVTANAVVIEASGTDKLMLDTTTHAAGQATTELLFAGDWLRLRSDDTGKWWCVGQAQLPGSIESSLIAFTTPGTHTFTVPAVLRSGRRMARVTVVAAGGGGGECGVSPGRGAGGSAGGAALKRVNLVGISSVSVVVGAGTTTNGGSSSFGAHCSATGGRGGEAYTGSSAAGPVGGDGVGGDLNISGGPGSDAPVQVGVGDGGSGDGGASIVGGGGRSSSGNGIDGKAPGSGGGGSKNNYRSTGADGMVTIEW